MNYAQLEHDLCHNPTLAMCRRQGSTHNAYNWAPKPWGHWSQEHKDAYMEGYNELLPAG